MKVRRKADAAARSPALCGVAVNGKRLLCGLRACERTPSAVQKCQAIKEGRVAARRGMASARAPLARGD
ncbi:hypothetical protein FGB62_43g015 [Gracilaria domingensis]|nr:hypothetical protein FGB62_43g015 [Gracilaria domingensis]